MAKGEQITLYFWNVYSQRHQPINTFLVDNRHLLLGAAVFWTENYKGRTLSMIRFG